MLETTNIPQEQNQIPNVENKDQYDILFPPLVNRKSKVVIESKCSNNITLEKKQHQEKIYSNLIQLDLPVLVVTQSKKKKDSTINRTENISQKHNYLRRKRSKNPEKLTSENVKKRKILNRREMSDEDRRKYWSSFKAAARLEIRQQNEFKFKQIAAAEKSNQRSRKRQENEREL